MIGFKFRQSVDVRSRLLLSAVLAVHLAVIESASHRQRVACGPALTPHPGGFVTQGRSGKSIPYAVFRGKGADMLIAVESIGW